MLIPSSHFLPVSSKEVFPHDPVMETVAIRKICNLNILLYDKEFQKNTQ
jgi:hypothetical protein